jgi:hypothetical protein
MTSYSFSGMVVNVSEPSQIDYAAEMRERAYEDLKQRLEMRRISQGWHVWARRRGSMQDRRRPRWSGVVGAVAVVVAVLVAWQVLSQGLASAATVPTATVVSELTPFDSTSPKTIAALCPAGKRVIGGGARINGGEHVVLTRLEPVQAGAGDSYVVEASEDQTGFADPWALQAYAICADPPPGLQIVSAPGVLGSDAFLGVSARCPAGKFAVGAGGRINSGEGQVALSTIAEGGLWSTRTTAGGTEDPDQFAGTWSVTAFAVCVTPTSLSDLRIVKVQSANNADALKITEAWCPSGKKVTGGTAFSNFPGVVQSVTPDANRLRIQGIASNDSPVGGTWDLTVVALCAS